VFTLLWHNTSLFAPYGQHYLRTLSLLLGARNHEWENELEKLRQELRKFSPKRVRARA